MTSYVNTTFYDGCFVIFSCIIVYYSGYKVVKVECGNILILINLSLGIEDWISCLLTPWKWLLTCELLLRLCLQLFRVHNTVLFPVISFVHLSFVSVQCGDNNVTRGTL